MNTRPPRQLVLIPSYNPGLAVDATVVAARDHWDTVWVVADGSDDGSSERLLARAAQDPGLKVLLLPENRGKGAAVLAGMQAAARAGFTHVLTMDADGQHPAGQIPAFMAASRAAPDAMILGRPVFGPEAPRLRVNGRKVSNLWTGVETLGAGIGDSLFGFRVYPIAPLLAIMQKRRWMRRFDFDPEAVVRLSWAGVRAINLPAAVSYFRPEQGGVSHFRYGRDNLLLTGMHLRLLAGFLWRLPLLLWRRFTASPRSE
jgi:glycosyltransferase involved in cell wall biosynthesis